VPIVHLLAAKSGARRRIKAASKVARDVVMYAAGTVLVRV